MRKTVNPVKPVRVARRRTAAGRAMYMRSILSLRERKKSLLNKREKMLKKFSTGTAGSLSSVEPETASRPCSPLAPDLLWQGRDLGQWTSQRFQVVVWAVLSCQHLESTLKCAESPAVTLMTPGRNILDSPNLPTASEGSSALLKFM